MMNKHLDYVYNFENLGKNLREISKDYIRTESQNVTSRWFHANNVDLFIWQDENDNVIKQQVSFYGLITEWNLVDGVRTGVIVEEENNEKLGIPGSEVIQFDKKINQHCVDQSLELIKNAEAFVNGEKEILLANYKNNPTLDDMSSKEIFSQYSYLKKNKRSFWHFFKNNLKKLFGR